MYYILESYGNDYRSCGENVVKFSESKEELDVECQKLTDSYNNYKAKWKLAKDYFKKLEVISDAEFQFNIDNKTDNSISLKNYYILKHQTNYPISDNIKEFLLFKDGLIQGVVCEPNNYYYKVKEVIVAKYQ